MKIFLCIIFASIAFSTAQEKAKCAKNSLIEESVMSCYSQLNKEEQTEFKKHSESKMPAVQCMPKCVLEKMGFFKDGKFDTERIGSMTDNDVKNEILAKNIKRRYGNIVRAAQKMRDDCHKAREFIKRTRNAEKRRSYLKLAYCESFWISSKF